jgi:hypothetical protein
MGKFREFFGGMDVFAAEEVLQSRLLPGRAEGRF